MLDKNIEELFEKIVEEVRFDLKYSILNDDRIEKQAEKFLIHIKEKIGNDLILKNDDTIWFKFIKNEVENEQQNIYSGKSLFFPEMAEVFRKNN